jgi:hypothetical protein
MLEPLIHTTRGTVLSTTKHTPKRRRLTAVAIVTGIAGSLAIALSLGASLSAFTAVITNATNTASSAALAITETGTTGATGTCNSYDTTTNCTTINKYGGTTVPLVPGGTKTQTVTFTNSGTVAVASASLAPGACVATIVAGTGATTPTTPNTTAGNLCSVLQVAVYKGATATGTALYTGALSGFTASITTLGTLAVGASQAYTFLVTLPDTATTAIQGQQVSQPLVWTFNQ